MAEKENLEKENEENKNEETKKKSEIKEEKKESKPAVKKDSKKVKEEKVELEREYIIPLKKSILKVPRYKRAKKAVRTIREFLAKHMKVENRDIKKIKIDLYLNNELWFRGIKKPGNKIKVKAIKKSGIVYAELAEIPEHVKFVIARDKRKKEKSEKMKVKMPKHEEKEKESEEKKIDEAEKEKASIESGLAMQKKVAKELKHTAKPITGKQDNMAGKTQRKSMKK
jgi:large subunit ribosomal protein L31e